MEGRGEQGCGLDLSVPELFQGGGDRLPGTVGVAVRGEGGEALCYGVQGTLRIAVAAKGLPLVVVATGTTCRPKRPPPVGQSVWITADTAPPLLCRRSTVPQHSTAPAPARRTRSATRSPPSPLRRCGSCRRSSHQCPSGTGRAPLPHGSGRTRWHGCSAGRRSPTAPNALAARSVPTLPLPGRASAGRPPVPPAARPAPRPPSSGSPCRAATADRR